MIIVFDTNIFIAAVINRGFLFDILDKVFARGSGYLVCISKEIRQELLEKLYEYNFDKEKIEHFLLVIDKFAYLVEPNEKINIVKADPDDNKILECAVAAEANLVVTMDKHLLKLKSFRQIAIVHPKTFSYMFPKG